MKNHQAKLPVFKPPTPLQPAPFTLGARVHLRSCLRGQPGVVQGMKRGRVIVHWEAWSYIGRHKPDRLVLVAEEK